MRLRHAILTAIAAAACAPELAIAQPPPPPPVVAPVSAASRPRSTWHFDVAAEGNWYENAYFLGPAAAESAWSTSGRATLANQTRFQNGTFSVSGFGGAIYYPEIDGFNQPTYGGSLGLTWTPARRTTLKLDLRYEKTSTRYLQQSVGPFETAIDGEFQPSAGSEDVPLPTSAADVGTGSIGLEQRLSQRWQLAADAYFSFYRYDDQLLRGSEQAYATASVGRQIGRRGSAYLAYAYSSSWFEEGKERSHQVLAGGRHSVERGLGIDVAGGVGYVESTEEWFPAGRVAVSAVGRRARLEIGYYRDFGQAYGYARQTVGDLVYGRLSWNAVRTLTLDAQYTYGHRFDPADESYTIVSGFASGGLHWSVGRGFGFDARYIWERNETEGISVLEGGRATASLTYGVSWP